MPGLQFSQSTDLAIHGLWALACLETGRFILLSDIASRQHVSESYLSKVFQKLTRAGLTRAMRGKRGGYTLARPPAQISVGDVVRAMAPEPPDVSVPGARTLLRGNRKLFTATCLCRS